MGGDTMLPNSNDEASPRPEYMLTTYDNPYDPFTQFDEWFVYDTGAGHHTPGLLDRIAMNSPDLSEADQFLAVQYAIDEIVRENVSGVHRKVLRKEQTTTTEKDS